MEKFLSSIKQAFLKRSIRPTIHIVSLREPSKYVKVSIGLVIFGISSLFLMTIYYFPKFLPETYVEGRRISGLSIDEATTKIILLAPTPPEHELELVFEKTEQLLASSSTQLGAKYEHRDALEQLLNQQRQNRLKWMEKLLFKQNSPKQYYLPIKYSSEKIIELVENFKQQIDTKDRDPKASLGVSGALWSLEIDPGKNAYSLDFEKTLALLIKVTQESSFSNNLKQTSKIKSLVKVEILSKKLSEKELEQAEIKVKDLVGKNIAFKLDHTKIELNDQNLISLLSFPEGMNVLEAEKIANNWKEKLDREPQEPMLEYHAGTLKVTKFSPPQDGLKLDKEETLSQWENILKNPKNALENTQVLRLKTTPPEKSLKATNELGIKELIGFGESYYAHSIPNRIHNVGITANKINYTIVKPGAEFSFNKTLGDVSSATGFRPAYVIKDGATILGDGGGVCQVSTTLFRSLLDAGLEITKRIPHSYRVSYYELDNQPGFDATVYSGNIDLRFVNDTEDHMLIYLETNSEDLYMKIELYGTSDGRTTEITQYSSWDARPPLPSEYVLDASLPTGKLKQIDWSASGIKTKFTHTVRNKNGEIMYQDEYYSNYRPWAAKFLQGA